MSPLAEILDTPRLRLRKPAPADAPVIFDAYARDALVTRYLIWKPHTHLAQTQAFIADCLSAWEQGRRRPFVLTYHGQDRPIGMLDARFREHQVEIGYVLARAEWGRGLMAEAVTALAEAVFSDAAIWRLQATCDEANVASQRVLEKSGFVREGLLKAYAVHPNISAIPRACYLYARCREAA